jgi:LuxR family transcriptional regulator, maltose regulon positive regulatory protein
VLVELDPIPAVPFEVVGSKLRIPAPRPGAVSRTGLVNRLRTARSFPMATVTAPAGYGKTTLLAQWAGRDERPFAWIRIDPRDSDPFVLLRHLAAALGAIGPVDASLVGALRSPDKSVWTAVVPRLLSALVSLEQPSVIVFDDVHLLGAGDSTSVLALLAENVREGSMIVVAGRSAPPGLPLAALRAGGRLFELGAADLALSRREAQMLVRNAGVDLSDSDLLQLVERTEGWAAGLHLVAQEDAPRGDGQDLAEYFRAECLSGLTPKRLAFLRRTSVLDTMSGPGCDAVLDENDSASELESLERLNVFLIPLDGQRESFRYHHLFRDLLRHELAEREPELVPVLHERAADWFCAQGDGESEIHHAEAVGDVERIARIAASIALPLYCRGKAATVERWLARFDDETLLERHPAIAMHGARIHARRGRPLEAERWLDIAGNGSSNADDMGPAVALLRAESCAQGVSRMLSDSAESLMGLPDRDPLRAPALLTHGVAHVLAGDDGRGDPLLAVAADLAERLGLAETFLLATAERSLVAAGRNDHAGAELHALRARDLLEEGALPGYTTISFPLSVCAQVFLRQGRSEQARAYLSRGRELATGLTHALPWLAVQTRLELARAQIALRDAGAARALLMEVGTILRFRPRLGRLTAQATGLRRELRAIPKAGGNGTLRLTAAELRLLPLLATHLSFREIGQRLFVSRNTIKTQAISVYRKLAVAKRSDAIDRAVELGLLDSGSASPTDLAALG